MGCHSKVYDQHKGDTLTKCHKTANICNTKHNDIASVAQSIQCLPLDYRDVIKVEE